MLCTVLVGSLRRALPDPQVGSNVFGLYRILRQCQHHEVRFHELEFREALEAQTQQSGLVQTLESARPNFIVETIWQYNVASCIFWSDDEYHDEHVHDHRCPTMWAAVFHCVIRDAGLGFLFAL